MKLVIGIVIGLALSIVGVTVGAQSFGSLTIATVGPSTSCPVPTVGNLIICPTTDKGVLFANNGSSYVSGSGSGVATFNGRTGNVAPTVGDYSYSQITGTPPPIVVGTVLTGSLNCSTNCTFTVSAIK